IRHPFSLSKLPRKISRGVRKMHLQKGGESGLWVELMWLLAIMEVSAQTILLADKPRSGCRGHQFSHAPGRPLLHFFLSLSQTSVGNRVSSRHVHHLSGSHISTRGGPHNVKSMALPLDT